jgi:hypothetical protein
MRSKRSSLLGQLIPFYLDIKIMHDLIPGILVAYS